MKKLILSILLCCVATGCIKDSKEKLENDGTEKTIIMDEYKFDSEVNYDFKDIPLEKATYEELSEFDLGRGIDSRGYAIDYSQGKLTGNKKEIKKSYVLCNEYIVNSGYIYTDLNQDIVKNNMANMEEEAYRELEGETEKKVSIIGFNVSLLYLDKEYELDYKELGEEAKKYLEEYGYNCFELVYGNYYNSRNITGVWKTIGVKIKTRATGCFVTEEAKKELVKVLKKDFLYGYENLNTNEKSIYDKLNSENIVYLSSYEKGNYKECYIENNNLKNYAEEFKKNAENQKIKGVVEREYTMYPEIKNILKQ